MAAQLKLVRRALSAATYVVDADQESVIAFRGSASQSKLAVFGGAGSGKSSTLVRAACARMDEGQDPNSILIITYGRQDH